MQRNIDDQCREIEDEFESNAMPWVKTCTTFWSWLASVAKQLLYKIGKSSLSIWNGVSIISALRFTGTTSHLQMSFPPSWIGINFHRSSHPGIFLVKKTFPFLVNLSELYTLIEEEITLGTMCHQTCLYQMSIHKLEQSFSSHLKQKRMFATWSCWPSVELVLRLQQLCPRSPGGGILQQKEQTRIGFFKDLRCLRFHLLPDWKK